MRKRNYLRYRRILVVTKAILIIIILIIKVIKSIYSFE